jgi:spore coat polysaccharide biosynthesis protein SpsF (cytidylyltransferase family)
VRYLNRHTHRTGIICHTYLLIPKGDHRLQVPKAGLAIIEGDEDDVLSRYMTLASKSGAKYIVRITSDCPLIHSPIITKLINIVAHTNYDYMSNCMPGYRTFFDGADCEVISNQLLDWINENANGRDREHVTSILNKSRPAWAQFGHLFTNIDTSSLKLSVDTNEDLINVQEHFKSVDEKTKRWSEVYGKETCHRF